MNDKKVTRKIMTRQKWRIENNVVIFNISDKNSMDKKNDFVIIEIDFY